MTGTAGYDVCVVGAGPAGAAIAALAAGCGRSVFLADSRQPGPDQPGEHLVGEVKPALEALGVDVAARPSAGTVSAWLPGDPVFTNPMTDPFGGARSIRRGDLDRALIDRSASAGAVVAGQHRFLGASRRPVGWQVAFRHSRGLRTIDADFLVDATGRHTAVARSFGATAVRSDSMTAFVAWLGPRDGLTDAFHMLHIEAIEDGWWAAIALPGDVLSLSFFTLLSSVRRRRLRVRDLWRRALDGSTVIAPLLPREAWHPDRLKAFPAAPALTRPMFGHDWLAAGDAAAQFDPIEGQGVRRALELAFRASEALRLERSERAQILPTYAAAVAAWHSDHLQQRSGVYRDGAARLGRGFFADLGCFAPRPVSARAQPLPDSSM